MKRLIIKNSLVCSHNNEFQEQNIHINEGIIENISSDPIDNIDSKHVTIIDARDYIAIPGMIDVHTHVREPGFTYKENFRSASMAAGAGGVTTIFDMPNTFPTTTSYHALSQKRKLARSSIIDYALHFGSCSPSNVDEIKKCSTYGNNNSILPPSVKIFLNETTGNLKIDSLDLLEEIVSNTWHITAHAEEEKIETIISLAQKYSVALYLCHISRKSEIDYIKSFRMQMQKNSSPIYVEVCPHHLAYSEDDKKNNALLSMKPPLQTKKDCLALWDAINDSQVDSIGSDHAPHTIHEKQYAVTHNKNMYGVPGLDTSLLYILDACYKKKISLQKIMQLCSQNPAKIFSIKNKGSLQIQKHADIALIKLQKNATLYTNETIFSKCAWSIFNTQPLHSIIGATMCRGNIVFITHNLLQKSYNINIDTILSSNARGKILFNKGMELKCHVT